MDPDDHLARVADYLDDKLQVPDDLAALDDLLASLHNQHQLLQQQLKDAEDDLQAARLASHGADEALQLQAAQFEQDQRDIDRRLMIITLSETSDEAVANFEDAMGKLRRLDIATNYLELFQDVDKLCNDTLSHLKTSDEEAVRSYRQLQQLVSVLVPLQEDAEGAAPNLLYSITKASEKIGKQIKDKFCADMELVLKKMGWPNTSSVPLTLQDEWDKCVGKLLDLQMPELEAAEKKQKANLPILLPLQILAHPLELSFRYHFEGDRPTNRLDKPEYFLMRVTDLLSKHNDFVVDNIQPILSDRFRQSDLALNSAYIDATTAFITALLPMLRTKISKTMPQVATQPQLISHWIHEVMGFDTILRDEWRYDGGQGSEGWKGLAGELLDEWFERWLQVEKDFALSRYQEIIDTEGSGELDYDSVEPTATKPTNAAVRVNDLLETITDRYRPLTSFAQKLRFLIDIQISIFDRFHERLHSSLEAYMTLTSTIGRAVQNISKEEQSSLQGVSGLNRLCRVYGSANYLEKAMRDWGDDLFFLELWEELQDRARHSSGAAVAGSMSLDDIAERTSSAVRSADDTSGALFDETAGAYSRLRVRSENIIVESLVHYAREALKPYRSANPWTTISTPISPHGGSASASTTTPELSPLLETLSSSIAFLSRALAMAPLRRILRPVLLAIQQVIWDSVLMRHMFSTAGSAQLATDVASICRVIDQAAGDGMAETGLRRLREAVLLLRLPVRGQRKGFLEVMSPDTDSNKLGLWEVERRLFADNESAREILSLLGCEVLNETEARGVLERRVELGS